MQVFFLSVGRLLGGGRVVIMVMGFSENLLVFAKRWLQERAAHLPRLSVYIP